MAAEAIHVYDEELLDFIDFINMVIDVGASNTIRYIFTGEEGEVIPRNATHVSVHPSVTVIREGAFEEHQNIFELVCHAGVIKIEARAFSDCPRLKRVILKGAEEVEWGAFQWCKALTYVECDKLEIIRETSFYHCFSLSGLKLPSAKIISPGVFCRCKHLKYVICGKRLESFGYGAFYMCSSLERITIPLKNGLFDGDSGQCSSQCSILFDEDSDDNDDDEIFVRCDNLTRHNRSIAMS